MAYASDLITTPKINALVTTLTTLGKFLELSVRVNEDGDSVMRESTTAVWFECVMADGESRAYAFWSKVQSKGWVDVRCNSLTFY